MPSAPGQVIATRETDTSVLIQWAPPKEPNNLIGYYIDQCVKGSKDWTSANHKPRKNAKYVYYQTKKFQKCVSLIVGYSVARRDVLFYVILSHQVCG